MKESKEVLFAIYKNGNHIGNEKGDNTDTAIKKYLIASLYKEYAENLEFHSIYSAKKAIKGVHYF
ncbi:hypothetical protein OAA67_01565 [Winogradskyella sp.]|nr:hypothetical protein [Winogradskyella sp.]